VVEVVPDTRLDAELVEQVGDVVTALFLPATGLEVERDSLVACVPLRRRYDSWPLGDATRLNFSESGACDGAVDRWMLAVVVVVEVVTLLTNDSDVFLPA